MIIERIQAEMILRSTCLPNRCVFAQENKAGDVACTALPDGEVVSKLTSCGGTGCSIAARVSEQDSGKVEPGIMFPGRFVPVSGLQGREDYVEGILKPEPELG